VEFLDAHMTMASSGLYASLGNVAFSSPRALLLSQSRRYSAKAILLMIRLAPAFTDLSSALC
jgi:hypothetical protein